MDQKRSPKGRKRGAKTVEDHFWDCSVCTYKNNPEAFKCLMCDVRKGTSTRKPRLNPDLVAVQVQQALTPPPPVFRTPREDGLDMEPEPGPSSMSGKLSKKNKTLSSLMKEKKPKGAGHRAKLKNVDRKNATQHNITVDNVTVVITEYKLKSKKDKKGGGEDESGGENSSPSKDTTANSSGLLDEANESRNAEEEREENGADNFDNSRSS